MNHFEYRDGALYCEGVALSDIAERVGTPAYVYSRATLARHYRVFKDAFLPREVLVAFAVKANSNIAVIATLAKLGAGADTVSAGEITRALKAGVTPDKIIFSGVGKTADELEYAIATGVHQINVESIAELGLLEGIAARRGARPAVAIRVNPDIGAGDNEKISTGKTDAKFGVSLADAARLYARACASPHLHAVGLAVHIGSQIKALTPLEAAFRQLKALAQDLRASGHSLTRLDLGGGLGVPYFNEPPPPSPTEYAAMVHGVFGDFDAHLAFEPGRLIAANAGILLSRVVRTQDRPGRNILVVDAAMNDLIRPAMYDAYHDIWPVHVIANAETAPHDVVGPVCETGDTFARARALPAFEDGALVAFMSAGAYGAVMSSTYNTRALTPEVLVDSDRFAIVRRRFEPADQIALETLPEFL
jgi:diaminopimelate decarboxylase